MALIADKGVDFKKQHQKKMAKVSRKDKKVKSKKQADDWEDVDEESEDGGVALDEEKDVSSDEEQGVQVSL